KPLCSQRAIKLYIWVFNFSFDFIAAKLSPQSLLINMYVPGCLRKIKVSRNIAYQHWRTQTTDNSYSTHQAWKYTYDDRGFRVKKFDNQTQATTWYVRDASGNMISTYTKENTAALQRTEVPVYDSGRLGMATCNTTGGITSYTYELTDHLGNGRATLGKSVADNTTQLLTVTDYYPFGMTMPGRNYTLNNYRFGYQGQFAEKEEETDYNQFEARLYDARIGRWMVPDPAGQFWSPYLGMGNNPVMGIDHDGRYKWEWWANLVNDYIGGQGVFYDKQREEYGVWDTQRDAEAPKIYENQIDGVSLSAQYEGTYFYIKGGFRIDKGVLALNGNIARIAIGGHLVNSSQTIAGANFEFIPSDLKDKFRGNIYDNTFGYETALQNGWGVGLLGSYSKTANYETVSILILGANTTTYSDIEHGQRYKNNSSWGSGFKFGLHIALDINIEFGIKSSNWQYYD
ncbi:MAG: RHS repeat domain-containing protein, partial [Salinivirgaceae bacterium]